MIIVILMQLALINLTTLVCAINQLTSLDVSQNQNLTTLNCHTNNLMSLDCRNGNNVNISNSNFNATNNPPFLTRLLST